MALKLYFSHFSPPARAVYMLLKVLNLQVDIKNANFLSKDFVRSDVAKINPMHTVPTLQDGALVVGDSHAIMSYLVNQYAISDQLYPLDPQERALVDQRLHFDTGTLFPKVYDVYTPLLYGGATSISRKLKASVYEKYSILEKCLKKTKWIAGDYITIADLSCISSIGSLDYLLPIDYRTHPRLWLFLWKCKNMPNYNECYQTGLDMMGAHLQDVLVKMIHKKGGHVPPDISKARGPSVYV